MRRREPMLPTAGRGPEPVPAPLPLVVVPLALAVAGREVVPLALVPVPAWQKRRNGTDTASGIW